MITSSANGWSVSKALSMPANAHGARACPPPANFAVVTCETGVNWIGTATARAGYADGIARSGTFAAASPSTKASILLSCNNGPFNLLGLPNCSQGQTPDPGSRRDRRVGSEFALAQNWTFVRKPITSTWAQAAHRAVGPDRRRGSRSTSARRASVTTVGLNYRFSPGVVVAKY